MFSLAGVTPKLNTGVPPQGIEKSMPLTKLEKRKEKQTKEKTCALGHRSVVIQFRVQHQNHLSARKTKNIYIKEEKERTPVHWDRNGQRPQFHSPTPIFPNQL